jgi:hypothetical protein
MSPRRRFLLVARIGRDSLHRHWLGVEPERGFDVLLSAYDSAVEPVAAPGVTFEYRPGSKVAGYAALFDAHRHRLEDYDYIALFDDDLLADAPRIARLFQIVAEHKLKIAQPALTHDSHFTYAALLRHPSFHLRYMTQIEMMCPVFRSDVLFQVLPLFALGYESGIDLIWCNLTSGSPRDFAVIDATPVRHTRRIGTSKASNGFVGGRRYEDDIHGILGRFNLPWLPCLPYGAIGVDGAFVEHRMAFAPDAARLALIAPRQAPFLDRSRNIAVYWKHLLLRDARNLSVAWPAASVDSAVGPAGSG